MYKLLANAGLVNEGRILHADLLVKNDRIERIGSGPTPAGTDILDLKGCYVLPGLIDDQVHCREPGLTHKGTLATESLAAACGGVTSFLDMPLIFACLVALSIVGILFSYIVDGLEVLLMPWQRKG